jgi:cysteine desulfurase/selenocysteine lyase
MLNVGKIRKDFPILGAKVGKRPLVYLDSAATMQCPGPVLDTVRYHYEHFHSNVHRGIHRLSEAATENMEAARTELAAFIGAGNPGEIIFTSGTTDGINMAAAMLESAVIKPGDEIIVSGMEHHSDLIPWQVLCRRIGAELTVWPVEDDGTLSLDRLESLLSDKTVLLCVCLVSNVLGTVNPVHEAAKLAHAHGALVLADCAQAMRHGKLDVSENGYDIAVFSGHKMGAMTGTGVLYINGSLLSSLSPARFGGGTVDTVTYTGCSFTDSVSRFEAGTPNIAGIVSLRAAASYLDSIGIDGIAAYEKSLTEYTRDRLRELSGFEVLGSAPETAGAVSFNHRKLHCYDVASLLDRLGIAVRSGHHCAQPLLARFGLEGAVRVSPAFYNTTEEIDALISALLRIDEVTK